MKINWLCFIHWWWCCFSLIDTECDKFSVKVCLRQNVCVIWTLKKGHITAYHILRKMWFKIMHCSLKWYCFCFQVVRFIKFKLYNFSKKQRFKSEANMWTTTSNLMKISKHTGTENFLSIINSILTKYFKMFSYGQKKYISNVLLISVNSGLTKKRQKSKMQAIEMKFLRKVGKFNCRILK
mgnify:CR=1 FL=1